MVFDINDFSPVCYPLSPVIMCTIQNDVDCLIKSDVCSALSLRSEPPFSGFNFPLFINSWI